MDRRLSFLRSIYARVANSSIRRPHAHALLETVRLDAKEITYAALTDSVAKPQAVQLMNLFQTEGREADATVVILREGDYMGDEGEP